LSLGNTQTNARGNLWKVFPPRAGGRTRAEPRCRSEKVRSVLSPFDRLHFRNITQGCHFLLLKSSHHQSINLSRCFHFRSVPLSSDHPCLLLRVLRAPSPFGVLVHQKPDSEARGCVRGTEPRLVATLSRPSTHPHIPLFQVRHKNLFAALSSIIASMTLNVGVIHSFWRKSCITNSKLRPQLACHCVDISMACLVLPSTPPASPSQSKRGGGLGRRY
jgi:hypothetical protein